MAREANSWGADLVISIHNNAGGGDGFEVYHTVGGGKGKVLAQNIEAEVKKIQNSRGLKTKKDVDGTDYYGMIRLTNAPAVICEGVFVDNATDVQIADTAEEQRAFGYAYARGILKTLGTADNGLPGASGSAATTGAFKVKVTIKDLHIRTGPGTNYGKKGFIKPGVYTIVETRSGWGKLKSGAGWIYLAYAVKI